MNLGIQVVAVIGTGHVVERLGAAHLRARGKAMTVAVAVEIERRLDAVVDDGVAVIVLAVARFLDRQTLRARRIGVQRAVRFACQSVAGAFADAHFGARKARLRRRHAQEARDAVGGFQRHGNRVHALAVGRGRHRRIAAAGRSAERRVVETQRRSRAIERHRIEVVRAIRREHALLDALVPRPLGAVNRIIGQRVAQRLADGQLGRERERLRAERRRRRLGRGFHRIEHRRTALRCGRTGTADQTCQRTKRQQRVELLHL